MSNDQKQPISSIHPCPFCFLLVSDDWQSCPYCGKTLSGSLLKTGKPRPENGSFCSQCGKSVEDDNAPCPHCDADSADLPGDYCTACGTPLAVDWKACPYCGEKAGTSFETEDDIWPFEFPCPQCSLPVRNDWEVCPRCEERLFYE